MSVQITTAFKKQYSNSFGLLLQQMESKLEGAVRKESQQAEVKFWDYIGEVSPVWDPARHADTVQIDTPHSRRALKLRTAVWADLIDEDDKIQSLADPTSDYLRVAVAAMNRAKDEVILTALGAAVLTGKEGTTSVAQYEEGGVINGAGTVQGNGTVETASTETGLTITKLGQVKTLMDNADVPAEGRIFVANYTNQTYILGSTRVTSGDYATIKALSRGEIDTYMGFKFVWLPDDRFVTNTIDTGTYECFAYHRDAVLLATAKDIETKVSEMPDKNYSVQAYAKMRIGAVRLQGQGVVKVLLDKDPAADFTQA